MFDAIDPDIIPLTDPRDGSPYQNQGTALLYTLLNIQTAALPGGADYAVSFSLGTPNPYRPRLKTAATWQGAVLLQGLDDVGCGGTSVLRAMAQGFLPPTTRFQGPVVA